ncbi:MAG: ribbon-helix-helix protein, CopG family [Acidobacteriota bacterium]
MGTRTVRLDDETERTLEEIRRSTGLSISEVLKRGITAFRKEVASEALPTPFEIYRQLDLDPGGHAIAPSTEVRRGVREALRKKLRR